MPDIDGETFLKILKTEDGVKNTPFVMLTSQEGAETEVNILKDGADDYIPKPLQPDKIYLRIRNILIRTYGEVFIFNDSE
ncbi:MAG TPA: response regulator transcription factor [Bacteroidetes bacterium]|nr:response regulator transcription factor [Bacteroidota bacterium]